MLKVSVLSSIMIVVRINAMFSTLQMKFLYKARDQEIILDRGLEYSFKSKKNNENCAEWKSSIKILLNFNV